MQVRRPCVSCLLQLERANVFNRITPVFAQRWHKQETQEFVSEKLEEIVTSRHRVAHRAEALTISRVQLSEWPEFLSTLAPVLDEDLEAHVRSILSRRRTIGQLAKLLLATDMGSDGVVCTTTSIGWAEGRVPSEQAVGFSADWS
jgi:hypothetical protein